MASGIEIVGNVIGYADGKYVGNVSIGQHWCDGPEGVVGPPVPVHVYVYTDEARPLNEWLASHGYTTVSGADYAAKTERTKELFARNGGDFFCCALDCTGHIVMAARITERRDAPLTITRVEFVPRLSQWERSSIPAEQLSPSAVAYLSA